MSTANRAGNGPDLFFPVLGSLYSAGREPAYLLLRVVAGGFQVPHGWGKLFGGTDGTAQFFAGIGLEPAYLLAILAGTQEVLGGLCIALGLLTRFWAAGAAILLGVVAIAVHSPNGFFASGGGIEFTALWAVVMIHILFQGGGPISVDRLIRREL